LADCKRIRYTANATRLEKCPIGQVVLHGRLCPSDQAIPGTFDNYSAS